LSEILTQEEIDALMAAFAAGERDADRGSHGGVQEVKSYDFARPDKYSKQQIRDLRVVHSSFARSLEQMMSSLLRMEVAIHLMSVDQMACAEYESCVPNPSVIGVFSADGLPGQGAFEMNPNIACSIIDRMMGGTGAVGEPSRKLTSIERHLIRSVLNRGLEVYANELTPIVAVQPCVTEVAPDVPSCQISAPRQMTVVCCFEVKLGSTTGSMSLCLTSETVDFLVEALNQTKQKNTGAVNAATQSAVKESLGDAEVECAVILGAADVSVGDVLNLAAGDVIKLSRSVRGELEVRMDDQTRFYGKPGLAQGRMAIQVTKISEEFAEGPAVQAAA
jgi:flagellar motor switch protein FliM